MLRRMHFLLGIVPVVLLLAIASVSYADGIDAAPYLRIGAGARSLGMGRAYTAVADDATANVWNAAGLSEVEDWSFTFYTAKLNFDTKHNFLSIAKDVGENGALAFSWTNYGVGAIEEWVTGAEDKPVSLFDYSSNAYTIGYGHSLDKYSLGGGFELISRGDSLEGGLGSSSKTGFGGLDLGALIYAFKDEASGQDTVRGAISLRNLLGKVDGDTIPALLNLGVSFKVLQRHEAIVSVELEHEFVDLPESTTSIRLGAEYWLGGVLAFRAGGNHTGDRRSLYAGFGARVASVQLDYAFKPSDDTINQLDGNAHFVSLSYSY